MKKKVRYEDDEQIIEINGFDKDEAVEMIDRIRTATMDVQNEALEQDGVELVESHNGTSRSIQTESRAKNAESRAANSTTKAADT